MELFKNDAIVHLNLLLETTKSNKTTQQLLARMSNADDSSPLKSHGGAYVAYGILALLLYVLSSAPAWWLVQHGGLSRNAFRTIYGPIIYLADNTVLSDPLLWYMTFLVR